MQKLEILVSLSKIQFSFHILINYIIHVYV